MNKGAWQEKSFKNKQRVQHSFIFWVALPLPLIAINLSGTPAPTPELKIEWHSFSTPFKWVHTLFSTPIAKFSDRKLQNIKRFSDWIEEKIFLCYFNTCVFGTLLSNYPFYSAFTCNIFEQLIIYIFDEIVFNNSLSKFQEWHSSL